MRVFEDTVDFGCILVVAGEYGGWRHGVTLPGNASWVRRQLARREVAKRLRSRPFKRDLRRTR